MADSKKYNGSTWEHSLRKLTTATDTLTTLPAVLYPTDTTATVGLKGNTIQSGTPTPDNPIMPRGTGNRTGNLWNEEGFSAIAITSTHAHTDTNTNGTTLSTTIGKETIITQSKYPTGNAGYQNGFFFIDVDFSKYEIGDKVTLSFDYICNEVHSIENQISTVLYAGKGSNSIPVVLSSGKWSVSGRLTTVITVIAGMDPYVEVRLCGNSITVKNIMLNTGSTALPYEPFGVKIPISSAGQTSNIYLGEVETTRKIKKLVLTGTETWSTYSSGVVHQFYTQGNRIGGVANSSAYSTIAPYGMTSDNRNGNYGCYTVTNGDEIAFQMYGSSVDIPTQTKWEAYLAAQYAAGTPVTVWYVLATPETGIVNEPLMCIGDYADTVSGITIPTITGKDTFDVETTLKPSEVSLSYTGWHNATVKEWDGSQWNE